MTHQQEGLQWTTQQIYIGNFWWTTTYPQDKPVVNWALPNLQPNINSMSPCLHEIITSNFNWLAKELMNTIWCIIKSSGNSRGFLFFFLNWLCWVLVAACRIFIAVRGLLSSCGAWTPEHVGSVVVAHRLSCPTACGISVPQPGIKPASPALEGGFLLLDRQGSP